MSMQEAPDAPVWRVADGVEAMFPAHRVSSDWLEHPDIVKNHSF